MAKRTDLQNTIVTAGKFVERGSKSVDMRERLRRMSQIVSAQQGNSSIIGLEQIASDNVITPDEKKLIAEEWEHIQAAYNSTVSSVNSLGVNPEEFQQFKTAFLSLESFVNMILADMSQTTQTDGRFSVAMQAYESAATILQNWINAYQNSLTTDISSYRLAIDRSPSQVTPGDTVVFSAHIFIDEVDRTDDLIASYKDADTGLAPDLFNWIIEGTTDDEEAMKEANGKRMFSIQSTAFKADSIRVWFSSVLNVG